MESNVQPQAGPPSAPVAQVLPAAPPRKRAFSFARLLAVLLALGLFGSLLVNAMLLALVVASSSEGDGRVQEKFFSHDKRGRDKVAILSLEGMILDGEGFFKRQIDRAREDAKNGNLKAIVLRVNSPGGTITGSDAMYHQLRTLVKDTGLPLVVSMGPMAASGGYYVSMAVGDTPDAIFAERSTWTGSIGVIIPHYDLSDLAEHWGVQEDSITSHRLKGMGSLTRKMTEEERAIFQVLVDDAFVQFKEVVHGGRPKFRADPAALDKLATGQVFTAEQAKQAGLIDEIGFLDAAVDRAIALAGLDPAEVRVVKYKPEPTLMDVLLGGRAQAKPALDLAALLELSTPRAYYLCTWLPPAASSYGR